MNDYIFAADLLNTFSQLTPWVQAALGLGFFAMVAAAMYFLKEAVRAIAAFPRRQSR